MIAKLASLAVSKADDPQAMSSLQKAPNPLMTPANSLKSPL